MSDKYLYSVELTLKDEWYLDNGGVPHFMKDSEKARAGTFKKIHDPLPARVGAVVRIENNEIAVRRGVDEWSVTGDYRAYTDSQISRYNWQPMGLV